MQVNPKALSPETICKKMWSVKYFNGRRQEKKSQLNITIEHAKDKRLATQK